MLRAATGHGFSVASSAELYGVSRVMSRMLRFLTLFFGHLTVLRGGGSAYAMPASHWAAGTPAWFASICSVFLRQSWRRSRRIGGAATAETPSTNRKLFRQQTYLHDRTNVAE